MRRKAAKRELATAGATLLGRLQEDAQPGRADVLEAGEVQHDSRPTLDLLCQHLVQILGGVAVQATLNREDQNFPVRRFTYLHRPSTSPPSCCRALLWQQFLKAQPISLIFSAIAKIIHQRSQKMYPQTPDRPGLHGGIQIRGRYLQRIEGTPIVLNLYLHRRGFTPQPDSDLLPTISFIVAVADDVGHQLVQNEVEVIGGPWWNVLIVAEPFHSRGEPVGLPEVVA